MNIHAGHRHSIAVGTLFACCLANAEIVTVETVTEPLPGESQAELVARVTPQLQLKALQSQNGTIARVTSDNGERFERQLKLFQGGITKSTLIEVAPALSNGQPGSAVRVTMAFDIDLKSGMEFGQMLAQNTTLKAHLGELADAAATNPVSQSVMADMAKQKYQALVDIAGTTATVRSGVAAAKLGQQIAQSTSSACSKRYDVASVSDIDIRPGMKGTIEAQATVVIKGVVDDCQLKSFVLGGWLGKSRTITPVSFKEGKNKVLHDFGRFSTGHEAPLWGFTTKKVLVGSMCQGDCNGRLNGDAAQRQYPLSWGFHQLKPLADGTGVQLRYYVTLPASLVSPSDELAFKVVPGA